VGTCTPSMDGTLGDLHSQNATFDRQSKSPQALTRSWSNRWIF
jgi:hypothetical protein